MYSFHLHFVKPWLWFWLVFITSCRWRSQAQSQRVCVGDQDKGFQLRSGLIDKKQFFSILFARGCGDTTCEGRQKLQISRRRRRDVSPTSNFLSWPTARNKRVRNCLQSLCGLLDCWVQDEATGICLWEKMFLGYWSSIGWVGETSEEDSYGRTVTNDLQDRTGMSRHTWGSAALELLLHKNWYQMTQPYKSGTAHTMDMWLLHQIRYSTWCELVPASLRLLKDRR